LSAHTPGPLAAKRIEKGKRAGHIAIFSPSEGQNETCAIAEVNGLYDEADANTALFVAAPDLLAACKALMRVAFHLSHCPADKDPEETCTCGYDEADEEGRAAIAKAVSK
jgi:hypothetical protein